MRRDRRPESRVRAALVPSAGLIAWLFALLLPAATARADVDVDVLFGHGGSWIADAVTPVRVILRNRAAAPVTVSVVVRQTGYGESDAFRCEREVPLGPSGARAEVFLLPGPTGYAPNVDVEIETSPSVPVHARDETGDRGRLTIELTDSLRASQGARPDRGGLVAVALDPRNAFASNVAGRQVRLDDDPEAKPTVVTALPVDADLLRAAPLLLDGFSTLVVCDPDATFCAEPAQLNSILDWVALGGRLVVSLGADSGSFAASPLAAYLPAARAPAVRGEYADVARALGAPVQERAAREGPVVALSPDASLGGDGDSVRVEARFGSGRIVVLGFDVRAMLETVALDDASVAGVLRAVIAPPAVHTWPDDPTQMRGTIDIADAVGTILRQDAFRPPPVGAVLLGLFVYVLVVGPLDWFVLRRMRKERLTTFTFAGAVVLFTVVAYTVSIFLFASDAVVNRITFVQFATGGTTGRELVRVHDLAGFYAPTSDTRRMEFPLPGTVLGGSLPGLRQTGGVGAALPVVLRGGDPFAPRAEVEIAFRSQRVVRTLLTGQTGRTFALRRVGGGDSLEVANELSVDLTDCWVFLPDGRVHVVGSIPAGEARGGPAPILTESLKLPGGEDSNVFSYGENHPELASSKESARFLAMLATSTMTSRREPDGWLALRAAGILRDPPEEGRALIVATARDLPFDLPGSREPGRRHVILVKETELP